MTERELKLIAAADTVLPDLNNLAPNLLAGPSVDKALSATYYDTTTLALARWGVTLRWRDEGLSATWTLKLPASAKKSTLAREEFNVAGSAQHVPEALAELVRVFQGGLDLMPVANVRTRRTETQLLLHGEFVATVCDDRVSADGAGIEPTVFREIEVELAPGIKPTTILESASKRLRKAGCHRETPTLAKVIRVLGPQAETPPDVVIGNVSSKANVGDLVRNVLAGSVDQIIRHDPGTRMGENPEDLHQYRVAARRLRSDLGTFAALLDPAWATSLREELRWIGGEAGVVRDADVLGIRLHDHFVDLAPSDSAAGQRLLSRLDRERSVARTSLLNSMSTPRYDELIVSLIAATNVPRFVQDRPRLPGRAAQGVLAELVSKRWRRLYEAAQVLTPASPDAELHEVRIKAKRCRYAAEAAANVHGRNARKFAAAVADVQEVLGAHQDTVVAEDWLRAAAKAVPSTGMVAGLAVAKERLDRARYREEFFATVWPATVRPALRSWLG